MTFRQCAEAYIAAHEPSWRGARATNRWSRSLALHVYPHIGEKDVAKITTEDVLAVLQPLWTAMPETAVQVRGRIELVLDWARVRGFRSAENVASWRGHLAHLLPKRNRVTQVKHHAAMPFKQLPAFMVELREQEGSDARCLEFLILTACRRAEAVLARWDEIDLEGRVWTVPAARTKSGRPHRIPLADAAVELLGQLPRLNEYVFPGAYRAHMSLVAPYLLLRRMGQGELTIHGFRSSFSTWARETTSFAREIVEAALAHTVGDAAERAYARSDALERRRALMAAWADYCNRQSAEVIPLRA
jgi:integrase